MAGPADQAGLKENDIILEVNGQKIDQANGLAELIQRYQAGDRIELRVLRQAEEKIIKVELGER